MNNVLVFFLAICSIIVSISLDHSPSSAFAVTTIFIIGVLYCKTVGRESRSGAYKTFFAVSSVYFLVSYVFSLSFDQQTSFGVSDSMRYLQYYQESRFYFRDWDYLKECYLFYTDNNGLYNTYIQAWAALGNNYFGGATVYYMTLAQTLFGILSSIVIYRILSRVDNTNAAKYSIAFSCCSLYLFYSSVIIRDIVAAYFFILAFDYILQEFKFQRLLLLVIFAFVVWGIRLYSGLYYFIFVLLYLALYLTRNSSRFATFLLLGIIGVFSLIIVATSALGEQTQAEIEGYAEYTMGRKADGFYSRLASLPFGIKQVALTLYSQVSPFPPYGLISSATSFSNKIMAWDHLVYEFFWYCVSYMVLALLLIRNHWKSISLVDFLLFIVSLAYIVVNTAHPDIRRMMPVYPFIYYLYVKFKNTLPKNMFGSTQKFLVFVYFAMLIIVSFR